MAATPTAIRKQLASVVNGHGPIDVLRVPHDDPVFARSVQAALAAPCTAGADLQTAVEQRLRVDYPRATVVPRHPLANLGWGDAWYVFRDGRLTSHEPDAPRRILVVEDDQALADLIADALTIADFAVRSAPNGLAALALLPAWEPSLILLDLSMPQMSGEEFAERYRSLPGPHAPLLVVSGARDATMRAERIAARSVVGKPFDIDALRQLVDRYA